MAVVPEYPNNLVAERTTAGFSSEDLATRAGIDPAWYAHIEAGEIMPTLAQLDRLVAALGDISPERLYMFGLVNTIGGNHPSDHPADYAKFFGSGVEAAHLLVAKDEVTWMERDLKPDRTVDV